MLKSVFRTREETEKHLRELRSWLHQVKDEPVEGMADFFGARIDCYDGNHLEHWPEEYAHIADYFEEGLETLLDLGCGTGLELQSIYNRFPEVKVTGIDLSKDMLARLKEKYRDQTIELIQADYFLYPFEEIQYDAALSFESLHHFKYEKKREIYHKLYRAIKEGGYYLECDYVACCEEEERLCLEGYEYRREKNGIPPDEFVHIDIPLTLEHQSELMKDAGFRQVEVLYQNCGTAILKAKK